jgi:CRP-like cAMP-binding protein
VTSAENRAAVGRRAAPARGRALPGSFWTRIAGASAGAHGDVQELLKAAAAGLPDRWEHGANLLAPADGAGTPPSAVVIVRSGLAVARTLHRSLPLRLYAAGDVVGLEAALLEPRTSVPARVVASGKVWGLTIPAQRFGAILSEGGCEVEARRVLAERLQLADALRYLSREPHDSSVAKALYLLAVRYTSPNRNGVRTLSLRHADLAALLTISLKALTASLKWLEGTGAIHQRYGRIEVCDLVALQRAAAEAEAEADAAAETVSEP